MSRRFKRRKIVILAQIWEARKSLVHSNYPSRRRNNRSWQLLERDVSFIHRKRELRITVEYSAKFEASIFNSTRGDIK